MIGKLESVGGFEMKVKCDVRVLVLLRIGEVGSLRNVFLGIKCKYIGVMYWLAVNRGVYVEFIGMLLESGYFIFLDF